MLCQKCNNTFIFRIIKIIYYSMSSWSSDIESILDKLRINSVQMSNQHKQSYFFYKQVVKYFRLPTIILSSVGSVSSVGLNSYLDQNHISALTCGLALLVSILNSIELFLRITDTMEKENECSKAFYSLSVNINKTLLLERQNRQLDGQVYLEKTYSSYMTLMEKSNLISGAIRDKFMEIPKNPSKIKKLLKSKKSDSSSTKSDTSDNPIQNIDLPSSNTTLDIPPISLEEMEQTL